MININLDILKRKKKFGKKNTEPNPEVYWAMILFLSFGLILASFVFGSLLFSDINTEDPAASPDGGKLGKISQKRIDARLKVYEERQNTSQEIISSPSPVVDPSL